MRLSRKIFFICIFVFIYTGTFIQYSFAENLELNTNAYTSGNTIIFDLKINNAPNDVKAFGLKIEFNPEILSYVSWEQEDQIKNRFNYFDCNPQNGLLTIGGGTIDSIKAGESINLVSLNFNILKNQNDTLRIVNLVDNFKNWTVKDGVIKNSQSSYEDVNQDGKVGLAEVINLLQIVSGF